MLILPFALFVLFADLSLTFAAPLDDSLAAAKKEGVLELFAPSTTGEKGARSAARSTRNMVST